MIPLGEAICQTNNARVSVARDHPVRKYLALSTLAAIKNATSACERTQGLGPLERADCSHLIVQECVGGPVERANLYTALLGELCREYLTGSAESIVRRFVQSLGLNEDQIRDACPSESGLGNIS